MVEVEGMILVHRPSEEKLRRLIEREEPFSRWQYERYANHAHAQMSGVDREHVRQELEIVADFEEELRREYPERSFVVTHLPCYAVSFYQAEGDAPMDSELISGSIKEKFWCQRCEARRPYVLLPVPDTEFPQAEWGRCGVCGNDLIVRSAEIRKLIQATG